MEKHNMKTNLSALGKTLKKSGVALFTGAALLTTPLAITEVHASTSYTSSTMNNLMSYFLETQASNVDRYLNKDATKTNLTRLLDYYDALYDYIYHNTTVQNTRYSGLDVYEQEVLNNLLVNWGNEIYERYSRTAYFSSTCQDTLGFTLKYNNTSTTGYDYNHNETMTYYEETLRDRFNNYMAKSKSQTNLTNALKIYNQYLDFIQGQIRSYGYVFNELTITEQEVIYRLIQSLSYEIMEYQGYSYYETTCISTIGWTVTQDNIEREVSKYYNNGNNNYYYPNNQVYPDYNNWTNAYPNNGYVNNGQYVASGTTPEAVQIAPSQVPNQEVYNNQNTYIPNNNGNINTTINKDWHADYYDPSVDTSYGDYYGNSYGNDIYAPEYVGDCYNNYNSYNSYNGYNDYNGYNNYYGDNYYGDYYGYDEAPEYVYIP